MTIHTEILVVGGGPAGLAAATAAARSGRSVTVLDDNADLGGQIWRGGIAAPGHKPGKGRQGKVKDRAFAEFRASGATLLAGRRVVDASAAGTLQALVEDAERSRIESFTWDRLILATGARERFLPFPGWTLPGCFGAGGLQALVKAGFAVRGKRVVVAGTGPLLLAVAAHLKEYGAIVTAVAEQAPLGRLMRFGAGMWRQPAKLLQGAGYRAALRGVPYRTGCWPLAALGSEAVTGVRLCDGKRTWTERCDLLACGFHLVPNTELAMLLGCRLDGDEVRVDEDQQTSQPAIYCAGEPTGVAGLDAALLQGRIAGLHAAGQGAAAAKLRGKRDREKLFGRGLAAAFALRPELLRLAAADTVVCRCEDVRYGLLEAQPGWTDAKLQTRCGMGPCQGRICGPATHALFGWRNVSIRPPLFPIPLSAFCSGPAEISHEPDETTLLEETP